MFRPKAKKILHFINGVLKKYFYTDQNPYDFISIYKPDLKVEIIAKDFTITKNFPKYSSITPVLNEEANIENLLKSIEGQTLIPDQVVIVDGGSTDATIDKIKKYQQNSKLDILLIESPIKNLGYQRNLAIENARNNILLNADAGTILDRNYAANMIGVFAEYKDVDLVGGIHNSISPYRYYFMPREYYKYSIKPYGNAVAFKRDLALGEYPEYLSYAAEDTVFFYKYQKKSQNWVFNKNAFVLWGLPSNYAEVKNKLYHYMIGNFEAGFWPYFYYNYFLYPVLWNRLELNIFKENFYNFLMSQKNIEKEKRHIKGLCFIMAKDPIGDSENMRKKAYQMIEENYKVFFINYNKSSGDIGKTYLDTDITLLELIPCKSFSIQEFHNRYKELFEKATFVIEEENENTRSKCDYLKKRFPGMTIVTPVVVL